MDAIRGEPDAVNVLVIGAGIAGIGAAYYLQRDQPGRSFAILEARGASGGTWDLFRYPGVRSDSDLHTFGYEFRPWREREALAPAGKILSYLRDTAAEYGIDRHIRYHRRVLAAAWSTPEARWTVDVEHTDTGERSTLTCDWLFCASGYFRYDEGFTPRFPGRKRFAGPVVHPQHWPADLDYRGKRVVIIGSGATAVTLVPTMAGDAAHVTMLQRTPTYVLSVASQDKWDLRLRRLLGEDCAFAVTRRKFLLRQWALWRLCQRYPKTARWLIRRLTIRRLPAGYPVDEHFNPPYGPWDQRLCAAADGDLFRVIRRGTASVVTGRIATFTEAGVTLESGEQLAADVIVTATGLNMQALGGIALTVDGQPVRPADTFAYKGIMLSGVPNLAFAIGYTNSSWTLKVGLLCEHFCRLLDHMATHGYDTALPVPADPAMTPRPFFDFGGGYVQRALDQLPRQGGRAPWLISMSYHEDVRLLRRRGVEDPELHFRAGRDAGASTPPGPADLELAGQPSVRDR